MKPIIYTAPLLLAELVLEVSPAASRLPLTARNLSVDVSYTYRRRDGLDAGSVDVFVASAVKLRTIVGLADARNNMSLVIAAGTDIMEHLTARQMDWIEEHLPVPPC